MSIHDVENIEDWMPSANETFIPRFLRRIEDRLEQISNEMRSMHATIRSIQLELIIQVFRLEKLEAAARNNSSKAAVSDEDDVGEAFKDDEARQVEEALNNITDEVNSEGVPKPNILTPTSRTSHETRLPVTPLTRQRKLTFEDSSVFVRPIELTVVENRIYNYIFSEGNGGE